MSNDNKTTKEMRANEMTPAFPTHPGDVLKDEIEYRGISQRQLAEEMGIAYSALNEILNARRPVTEKTDEGGGGTIRLYPRRPAARRTSGLGKGIGTPRLLSINNEVIKPHRTFGPTALRSGNLITSFCIVSSRQWTI